MADVNLRVEATSSGIESTVKQIESLKASGISTSTALKTLGTTTVTAMANIQRATAAATTTAPFTGQAAATRTLSGGIKTLTQDYGRLAAVTRSYSATARLTQLGGGNLASGVKIATALEADAAAKAATPISDLNLLKSQGIALTNAQTAALNAQRSVATARWESELAAMTPVERANAVMLAAQRELTAATQAYAAANKAVVSNESVASLNAQADAATRLAAAERGVAAARAGVTSVRNAEAVQLAQRNLALTTAQTAATQAQAGVAAARWQRELAAMTPVERATAQVVRATQELAVATRLRNLAETRVNGAKTVQNLNLQTQAENRLAAAILAQIRAKQELVQVNSVVQSSNKNAFQSSYSYFIVAGLANQAAASIRDVGSASLEASAQIERGFADIQRTTEGTEAQLASLKSSLFALSTSTPISVVDLAQIATLGNQLGVAANDVESFTKTIAQYTAVSGQSAEDAATAFGRISNLTGLAASQYSNLASAITYVARTTVATESTIQNTSKEITALAAGSGFSADAIVGLAGALSSLAIPPERARGALSLYFGALNKAVAEGGPKMEAFATLTGKTTQELETLVRQNKGQEVFTAFISGLSRLDTVAKSSALDELGLSTIRVDQTMRALSQNVPLLTKSFEGANTAFNENVEISNQYAIIQKTLASQWKEFQNAVQNAAAAMGDGFAPAAKALLAILNGMLVAATAFANTPLGDVFVKGAGAAAIFVAVIASIVGVTALAFASLVVLRFAVEGFGWTVATGGIKGWIAALLIEDATVRRTTLSQFTFGAALKQTVGSMTLASVGARTLSVSLSLLKVALPILAIGAIISGITAMADAIDKAINPSKTLTDDLTGLKDALLTDNPDVFKKSLDGIANSATGAKPTVSSFNAAILTAIEVQKRAEGQFDDTNKAVDAQAFKLGNATKAWIATALASQEQIKDLIDGRDFWETIFDTSSGGDTNVSRDQFEKLLSSGLDLNKLSQVAATQGTEVAVAQYNAWKEGFEKANPGDTSAKLFGLFDLPGILSSVVDAYRKAKVEAALSGTAFEDTGITAVGVASDFDQMGKYIGAAADDGSDAAVTFIGVKNSLSTLQDAVSGAMGQFVDFKGVLTAVQDAAKKAQDAANGGGGKATNLLTSLVNAETFGTELDKATSKAGTFYDQLRRLAATGSTSFATQLAALGPDAENILATSLDLSPAGRQKLEASARFAAFLASDAFKTALQTDAENYDEAYARILLGGGSLGDVQSYIAAQVKGVGAAWEQEWLVNHPNLPLSVTPELTNLTDDEIKVYQALNSGRIKITPVLDIVPGNKLQEVSKLYTDTQTGAKIELPASLSGSALSTSLSAWFTDQKSKPAELYAKLNKPGLSASLDEWVTQHGPVTIRAIIQPYDSPLATKLPTPVFRRDGGPVPSFASGGQYGQISGPGSGVSDSIWARVSNKEYINSADSTTFWGPDFFDSLNRKMLPTSFLHMLEAAAVSGNRGPSHTTNVRVIQNYPQTVNPLKKLQEDSELLAAGIWG